MRRIGIEPRVPEQRNRDLGEGDRKRKTVHAGAQASGVPFGNAGDQVGGAGQGQRGRKAADDRDDLAFQPETIQGLVDRSLVETAPRHEDVPAGCITGGRHLAPAERVPPSHDADETVEEQALRTHLRAGRLSHDAGFEIDGRVAQRRAVLVRLLHEAQPHAGSLPADAGDQAAAEALHKAFAGPQGERPDQPTEVELFGRAQDRVSVLHEPTDSLAQRERAGCGDEAASGPDQERIARGLAQSRQRPAHRRRAEPQPLGCARHAAFREQHIEGDQQVEIGGRHPSTLAPFDRDVAPDARIKCKPCAFRHVWQSTRFPTAAPFGSGQKTERMLKPIIAGRDDALAASAQRTPSVRWALAGLSLSMLLASLGTSIANVALPTLAQAFAASFQAVQWIVLAYLLAITTLIVGAGRLGDITGRRRLLLAGIFLFTAASVLCGVAPTLWLLIAARAAQGLGSALMMALSVAFVSEIVGKAKTGSAMGLLGTTSAIGTALGPSLGGVLMAGVGWRAIFLVYAPLGILA